MSYSVLESERQRGTNTRHYITVQYSQSMYIVFYAEKHTVHSIYRLLKDAFAHIFSGKNTFTLIIYSWSIRPAITTNQVLILIAAM